MQQAEEIPLGQKKEKKEKEKKPQKKRATLNITNEEDKQTAVEMAGEDHMQITEQNKKEIMKVFLCKNYNTFYPLEPVAMVVAPSKERANEILMERLNELSRDNFFPETTWPLDLFEINLFHEQAQILCNGDFKKIEKK